MSDKPFSQSCENNKQPILEQLVCYFRNCRRVLEIGSGTGQHAVFFAEHLPHLHWHTCDQKHYHEGINTWINEAALANISRPLSLTLPYDTLPNLAFDGVFTANTAHIMQQQAVAALMQKVADALPIGGVFCQYGPFIQNGEFSSSSNQAFHEKLLREGYGGYRTIEELEQWADSLRLDEIITMPANNLLLVWVKH